LSGTEKFDHANACSQTVYNSMSYMVRPYKFLTEPPELESVVSEAEELSGLKIELIKIELEGVERVRVQFANSSGNIDMERTRNEITVSGHDVEATILVGLLDRCLREAKGDPGGADYKQPTFPITIADVNRENRKQKRLFGVSMVFMGCVYIAVFVGVIAILVSGVKYFWDLL